MYCSIYTVSSNEFKLYVDRDPDRKQENQYQFQLNRVVPVYMYFEGFRKGYLIRTCPGSCQLLNVDRPVTELMSVSGARAGYLRHITNIFRKYNIVMDDMPDHFFVKLSLIITGPRFKKQKALLLFREYRNRKK